MSDTLWARGLQHARLSCPSPVSRSLLKFMSIESVMPCNHLILCHLLLFLFSIFPSIRIFSSESVLHIRWTKYWSFSFSISPSKECWGLSSFMIDWFDIYIYIHTYIHTYTKLCIHPLQICFSQFCISVSGISILFFPENKILAVLLIRHFFTWHPV